MIPSGNKNIFSIFFIEQNPRRNNCKGELGIPE